MTGSMDRRRFVALGLGALAAPALVSCGPTPPPEGPGLPETRLTARPGEPTEAPRLGLSSLGLGSGRDGLLYVPTTYAGTPLPLFVALHGAGGSAKFWQGSYPTRAESRGFVLLAPDSRYSTWDMFAVGYPGADVRFLDEALQYTFARCRIDPARVLLGGFSDGASYALSLGVHNGDLFTHLVGYSPGIYGPPGAVVGQPRVWISHGTQDTVLPFVNTRDQIVPALIGENLDVTFQEFDGGHEVPAAISESALDWFFA
jgi:phospholipase/carboxylesterase